MLMNTPPQFEGWGGSRVLIYLRPWGGVLCGFTSYHPASAPPTETSSTPVSPPGPSAAPDEPPAERVTLPPAASPGQSPTVPVPSLGPSFLLWILCTLCCLLPLLLVGIPSADQNLGGGSPPPRPSLPTPSGTPGLRFFTRAHLTSLLLHPSCLSFPSTPTPHCTFLRSPSGVGHLSPPLGVCPSDF